MTPPFERRLDDRNKPAKSTLARGDAKPGFSGGFYLKRSDLLLPDEPRLSVLWRAKWIIAACAVIGGIVAAGIASIPSTVYSAQATVRVSLLSAKGVPRENVLAQNDLAAQYALLATSAPVLAEATATAKEPVGHITATPVDGYNIVGITATGPSAARSARRADAVATALVTYVTTTNNAAAAAAARAVAPQLKELDAEIASTQDAVTKLRSQLRDSSSSSSGGIQALLNSQITLLGTLVSDKADVFTSASRDAAATAPRLTLLDTPNAGTAVSNHALVYGIVSLLIVALAASEITVLAFRLRTLNQTQNRPEQSDGLHGDGHAVLPRTPNDVSSDAVTTALHPDRIAHR